MDNKISNLEDRVNLGLASCKSKEEILSTLSLVLEGWYDAQNIPDQLRTSKIGLFYRSEDLAGYTSRLYNVDVRAGIITQYRLKQGSVRLKDFIRFYQNQKVGSKVQSKQYYSRYFIPWLNSRDIIAGRIQIRPIVKISKELADVLERVAFKLNGGKVGAPDLGQPLSPLNAEAL